MFSLDDPSAAWKPGPNVLDHSGEPLDPQADFFAPPPAEIGEVQTARSTLRQGVHPRSIIVRFGLTVGPVAVLLAIGDYLTKRLDLQGDMVLLSVCGIVGVLVGAIAWAVTRFRHTCSYVGRNGVSQIVVRGGRDASPSVKTLLFSEAAELRTRETRRFVNGIYAGTTYAFIWTDAARHTRLRLSGDHQGKDKPPKPSDPYHFAARAEAAWSVFMLDRITKELEATGGVRFNLTGEDFVRVSPGRLELSVKGRSEELPTNEIQSFTIANGLFHVKHKDARWLSSKGKFSFSYADMANGRLFLLALEKLTGLSFAK